VKSATSGEAAGAAQVFGQMADVNRVPTLTGEEQL
jgi:hypothetical protein